MSLLLTRGVFVDLGRDVEKPPGPPSPPSLFAVGPSAQYLTHLCSGHAHSHFHFLQETSVYFLV